MAAGAHIKALIEIQTRKAQADTKKLAKEAKKLADEMGKLEDELEDVEDGLESIPADARKAATSLKRLGKEGRTSAKQLEGIKKGLGHPAVKAAGAALLVTGGSMLALGKASLDSASQMEQFQVQLEVLLKDSGLAKERLDELFKIGSTTPFELGELVQADVIMQSFGADANTLRTGVMDLAGALGTDLPTAAMAVSKSFGVGKAGSDGLRESFALLYTDVQRRAEILGDPSDIKIWQAAMTDALTATDSVVAGGTSKLANTWKGRMSNMADAWFKFKVSIAKAGLFDYANVALQKLLKTMDTS